MSGRNDWPMIGKLLAPLMVVWKSFQDDWLLRTSYGVLQNDSIVFNCWSIILWNQWMFEKFFWQNTLVVVGQSLRTGINGYPSESGFAQPSKYLWNINYTKSVRIKYLQECVQYQSWTASFPSRPTICCPRWSPPPGQRSPLRRGRTCKKWNELLRIGEDTF